jgi:hypothetical protein
MLRIHMPSAVVVLVVAALALGAFGQQTALSPASPGAERFPGR